MKSLTIHGGIPLNGVVTPSGSPLTAVLMIISSLYTSEDLVFENVPHGEYVESLLSLLKNLGADFRWLSESRLLINTSGVKTFRLPFEIECPGEVYFLLAAPLVFRFGQAILPKPRNKNDAYFLENFLDVWQRLGFNPTEDSDWLRLEAEQLSSADINFRTYSKFSTENAVFSSVFVPGKTTINNAAEDLEIDQLITLLNNMGAHIERVEPSRIEIEGQNIFKEASAEIKADKDEIVYFAVAALITGGTVNITEVERISVAPFLNLLNKIGTNYEFSGSGLTVWHGGEEFSPVKIISKPMPGVPAEWAPSLAVLLSQAQGESVILEKAPVSDWDFARDLNRMGGSISLGDRSEVIDAVSELGSSSADVEDLVMAKIKGPTSFRASTVDITDLRSGIALLLASLAAKGKTDLRGYEIVEARYNNFLKKFAQLGARIS